MDVTLCNGRVASAEDLRTPALRNYGHFTTLQVRDGAVRGLDLHLRRLREATRELFEIDLDPQRVRADLRAALALAGVDAAGARITVFARDWDPGAMSPPQAVDVLVALSPPAEPAATPLRVRSVRFARALPHLKHVGTFAQLQQRRAARRAGFDDALFVGEDGRISEGSVWNVGFWDGERIVWPRAPALRGTSERLLQMGLSEAGLAQAHREVHIADLPGFRAAFATYSRGVEAIAAIDGVELRDARALAERLAEVFAACPPQPI